jgi:sugar phosphate isomerase/epimerase
MGHQPRGAGERLKISVSAYSLHRNIGQGTISMLDFVGMAPTRFGVHEVELNSPFFRDEPDYLEKLLVAMKENDVHVGNIAVDQGNVADPDDSRRREYVSANAAWLDVADDLDCPSIRVNAGHSEDQAEGLERSIASFREIVNRARGLGLSVLMENHGGFSSDPDSILKYVDALGTENFGTCPDFGNFKEEIRYEALEKISPYAKFVHAKTYEFDSKGNETTLDIPRIIDILDDAGYDGYVSVEFEGPGDEFEGMLATIRLLQVCGLEL